jgi:hypothetical protein
MTQPIDTTPDDLRHVNALSISFHITDAQRFYLYELAGGLGLKRR